MDTYGEYVRLQAHRGPDDLRPRKARREGSLEEDMASGQKEMLSSELGAKWRVARSEFRSSEPVPRET
eukprot:5957-Hanusia_phi.AAC.1